MFDNDNLLNVNRIEFIGRFPRQDESERYKIFISTPMWLPGSSMQEVRDEIFLDNFKRLSDWLVGQYDVA